MAEYIFTNLPQYIRVTPRTDSANSVVQANHVLLFSEDGSTLTGKLPDGSFITIGDGTDVSDTTATAATVLSGYDFYNSSGVKTSGSIQTVTASASGNVVTIPAGYIASSQTLTIGTAVAAQTITPGTVDQTIAAGSYLTGAATIKGDTNLIAANIADGVTIFGVTGTHQGGGGGSTYFYKCASVDTVNSTWTGYKAVLNSGVYSFESTVTSGLTYGSGFTPDPDQIYPDSALIQIARMNGVIPPDYVYFDKLDSQTGWVIFSSGADIVTDSTLGRDVFQITTERGYFKTTAGILDVPYDCANRTMSFWMKKDASSVSSGWAGIGYGGGNEAGIRFVCGIYENYPSFSAWGYDIFQQSYGEINDLNWHHYAVTLTNGNTITMFKDGVQIFRATTSTLSTKHEYIVIGDVYERAYAPIASFANLRIYNRILTAAEITALAADFTLTPGA